MSENLDLNNASKTAESLIKKLNLDMQLLHVGYDEENQITFYFYSETRVDFRQLVKDLNSVLKTQIRLHQVGSRDKARFIGGYGPCGKTLCCTRFLSKFETITTKMLKAQNLPLNPSQFTGMCGKLMCCLAYEVEKEKKEEKKPLPEPLKSSKAPEIPKPTKPPKPPKEKPKRKRKFIRKLTLKKSKG